MVAQRVIDWLLEPEQPAIRYRTLTELLDRPESDPDVRAARREIPRTGWVADILAARDAAGWWAGPKSQYTPKYVSTNWRMIVLSDLGVDRSLPSIGASCEYWMGGFPLKGGGVGGNSKGAGHHCVVGNITRSLIRMGYADDPRIRVSLDWLVDTADPRGGWNCWGVPGRNLDSWEGLSAFAAYPRRKWTPRMEECVDRAAEFFLERELHRQGARYAPWFRTHYPVHYYYDLLVGLELMAGLGRGSDPRTEYARRWLARRRRPDGRWNLDAIHPDAGGAIGRWYAAHPNRVIPWGLESAGAPSKMITLRALLVERRLAE